MRTRLSVLATAFLALVASTGPSLAGPAIIQIPEPSSLALIAAGAGVLAWVKFRRRR